MADDAIDARLPLSVARDTIVHIQSPHFFHLLHSFNSTVASLTGKTGAKVWPVLKIYIVRHGSDFDPL